MRCGCSSWLGCIPYRIFLIAFLYHSLKSIPRRDALFFCPFTPRRRRRRKFGTLVRLLGVVWFPGVPGVRLPNLVSPPRSCRKRGYPQEFSTVWRTYSTVIHMSAYPDISRQNRVPNLKILLIHRIIHRCGEKSLPKIHRLERGFT